MRIESQRDQWPERVAAVVPRGDELQRQRSRDEENLRRREQEEAYAGMEDPHEFSSYSIDPDQFGELAERVRALLRKARTVLAAPPPADPDNPLPLMPMGPQPEPEPQPPASPRERKPVQKSLFPRPPKGPPEYVVAPPEIPDRPEEKRKGEPKGVQNALPSGPDFRWSESLPMNKMYKAVTDKYHAAPDDIKRWGSEWYDTAHEYIQSLAQATHRTPEQVAAVMAAFSPQTAWDPNMAQATHFLLNYDPEDAGGLRDQMGTLGDNYDRAVRVLEAHPDDVEAALSKGAGADAPKITNFYRNMMGDRDAVTIDTWMARALLGEGLEMGDSAAAQKALRWAGSYDRMSQAVQQAAKDLGVDPRALQAIVWTQVNPTADYGEYTPESFKAKGEQRAKNWRRSPPSKPLPDYTKGPGYDALMTPNPGKPILPPPTYKSAPGYHKASCEREALLVLGQAARILKQSGIQDNEYPPSWMHDVEQLARDTGGFTIHDVPGDEPTTGYQVAVPGYERDDINTGQGWADYATEYRDPLEGPDKYMGTWLGPDDKFITEPSERIEDYDDAARSMVDRSQWSMWDNGAFRIDPATGEKVWLMQSDPYGGMKPQADIPQSDIVNQGLAGATGFALARRDDRGRR